MPFSELRLINPHLASELRTKWVYFATTFQFPDDRRSGAPPDSVRFMNTTKNFGFIHYALAILLCSASSQAALVTFKITGTGVRGSTATGLFTIEDSGGTIFTPGYYGANIYTSCSLTISNIPGPGPNAVTFAGIEQPAGSTFQTTSDGVQLIAPLAWRDYGPPDQNYYRVDSSQPNYPGSLIYESTIIYDEYHPSAASDRITWSVATIVGPPPSLSIAGTPLGVEISWSTSVTATTLESTSSLADPITWTAVTNAVTEAGGKSSVTIATTTGSQFFRMRNQ